MVHASDDRILKGDFKLNSPEGIVAGEEIPDKYCKDGENKSPPLEWSGAPGVTQSYAISVTDLDAPKGTWVHWQSINIPKHVTSIAEACVGHACGSQLLNSWDKETRYDGPQPSEGTHRYIFTVYALTKKNIDHMCFT